MTAKLNHHDLHAKTQSKIRDFLLPSIARSLDFSFDTSRSKTTGDNDPICCFKFDQSPPLFQLRRMDPYDLGFDSCSKGCMRDCFSDTHVRVLELNILSNQRDAYARPISPFLSYQVLPLGPIGLLT